MNTISWYQNLASACEHALPDKRFCWTTIFMGGSSILMWSFVNANFEGALLPILDFFYDRFCLYPVAFCREKRSRSFLTDKRKCRNFENLTINSEIEAGSVIVVGHWVGDSLVLEVVCRIEQAGRTFRYIRDRSEILRSGKNRVKIKPTCSRKPRWPCRRPDRHPGLSSGWASSGRQPKREIWRFRSILTRRGIAWLQSEAAAAATARSWQSWWFDCSLACLWFNLICLPVSLPLPFQFLSLSLSLSLSSSSLLSKNTPSIQGGGTGRIVPLSSQAAFPSLLPFPPLIFSFKYWRLFFECLMPAPQGKEKVKDKTNSRNSIKSFCLVVLLQQCPPFPLPN